MKKFNENEFDEIFRQKFENFKEIPPENVFSKLQNTSNQIFNKPRITNGNIILFSSILIIATLYIIFTSVTYNNIKPITKHELKNTSAKNTFSTLTQNTEIKKPEIKTENSIVALSNEKNKLSKQSIIEVTTEDNILKDEIISNNKEPEVQPDYSIDYKVFPSVCRKNNGKIELTSNNTNVKFYCNDSQTSVTKLENLSSGTYRFKATLNTVSKNFSVFVPDSLVIKSRFTHNEMTQNIGVPVYFSSKSTIDGKIINENDNINYKWYFGDGFTSFEFSPEHLYNSTGPFVVSLIISNSYGCKDSSSSLPLYIAGANIDLPNTFSPNGDGNNDEFKPAVTAVKSFECVIFNSNGEVVYKWNDPNVGWDGKINNGLQTANPGIYFFVINAVGVDGKIINIKDFLYLFK